MKNRSLACLVAFTLFVVGAGRVVADVTSVTIDSPTSSSQVNVDAGSSLTVGITYNADNSGGPTIDLIVRLLSGGSVVGQTNVSIAKQFPGATTNLYLFVTNCTPNGTFALQVEATETASVTNTQADAVIITSGKPIAFTVTGGGAYCSGGSGVAVVVRVAFVRLRGVACLGEDDEHYQTNQSEASQHP